MKLKLLFALLLLAASIATSFQGYAATSTTVRGDKCNSYPSSDGDGCTLHCKNSRTGQIDSCWGTTCTINKDKTGGKCTSVTATGGPPPFRPLDMNVSIHDETGNVILEPNTESSSVPLQPASDVERSAF